MTEELVKYIQTIEKLCLYLFHNFKFVCRHHHFEEPKVFTKKLYSILIALVISKVDDYLASCYYK